MNRITLGSFALLLTALHGMVFAQGVTGTIAGNVADSSGGRLAEALVRVVNELTDEKREKTTDATGDYLFPNLPTGRYRIEVELMGFRKFTQQGIQLNVNQNARVDIKLELGALSQEIRVTGGAPLVDTREVQLGGVIETRRVNDLPLNGRNVYQLVTTLPGVANARLATGPDDTGNYFNVNGSRSRQSTFFLDGNMNNSHFRNSGNEAPNPDAVEEFRLITSNFNAEFGRSSGAVVNVITRSGTNQFHGSLFEFLRNNHLNARNFFVPTVQPLHQNQFGGSFGGPIKHDKLFFFTSYQGLRVRSSAFQNGALTATAAERRGDFSAAPANQKPIDPATGQPFPGGIIPAQRLDPVAAKILAQLVPLPNTADGRLETYQSMWNNAGQGLAKLDYQVNGSHRLSGSWFINRMSALQPFAGISQIPNYSPIVENVNQQNVVANDSWILSPSMLNEGRFGYTIRNRINSGPIRTSWSDFGSNVTYGALPPRPPQIFINGRWNMGTFDETERPEQTFSWSDTFSWTRSRHAVKVGTWLAYNRYEEYSNWLGSGQIRFTGAFTGNSLADFELGQAASFRQNNGNNRDFRSKNWHSFIQDDWKVSSRIVLNLGLRYELNTPWVSTADAFQTFSYGAHSQRFPKAPLGMLFANDPGIPRGVWKTDYNNFAPRFGIAIDPFGNGKTAIRAGYGVFYAIGFTNMAMDMQGQPFLVDVTVFGTPNLINPYANVAGGSPFPYKLDAQNPIFALPVTASYQDPNIATPYVQQYSFTIEQQFLKDFAFTLAYVGNTSRKLMVQSDANAPVFIPGQSTAGNINARRPYLPGTYAQISHAETASNAHYDSLQTTLNKRFSHGFTVLANYTLSKNIDEISDDKLNTAIAMVDSHNRRLEHGPSSLDTRHVFNASYVWDLPEAKAFGWFGKQVLSGWQLNGLLRIQSGNPFDVLAGSDVNLDGNANDRPNLVGTPYLDSSRPRSQLIAQYFNPKAFQIPKAGSDGTAGRNLIYGPGSYGWDASFFKNFALTERHKFQFRGEFFNFTNHTNLGQPVNTITSANAGRILSAGPARIVQFGAKYIF